MPGYPRLTRSERDQIAELKAQGLSVTAIAQAIGRHPSTLSRELRRYAHADGTYRPVFAEGSYWFRRQRAAVLEEDKALCSFVIDRLTEGWTPEQIAGWLKRGIEVGLQAISNETIYAFIFRATQKAGMLWRYLARRKASRGRRARRLMDKTLRKTHISERSDAANARDEVGHWEGDLVICKRNRHLLVLHERKTRLTSCDHNGVPDLSVIVDNQNVRQIHHCTLFLEQPRRVRMYFVSECINGLARDQWIQSFLGPGMVRGLLVPISQ